MIESEGLERVLPGVSSLKEGVDVYRQFYTEEDEKVYGVVAITIEFLKDQQLALALFSGHVKVLDAQSSVVIASYREHEGRVWTICKITSDLFASGADDGYLKIWDIRQPKSSHSLGKHSGRVSCTLLQNENTILAASCPNDPHNSKEKASFTQWDLRKY
jgi:WD40 repeat protein